MQEARADHQEQNAQEFDPSVYSLKQSGFLRLIFRKDELFQHSDHTFQRAVDKMKAQFFIRQSGSRFINRPVHLKPGRKVHLNPR